MREIIVDNFAGGGGASTGIEMAIGRSVDIAINHDPNAVAMHTTNHPDTLHYCESVFDVNPQLATAGRPVGAGVVLPGLSPLLESQRLEAGGERDSRSGVDRHSLGAGGATARDDAGERGGVQNVGAAHRIG